MHEKTTTHEKTRTDTNLMILMLLMLVAMGSLAASMQAQLIGSQDPIVGAWVFTVTADSGPPFQVYETYAPGGALSAIDNEAPASEETVAVGVWRKVGARKYYEDQWQYLYDQDGNFVGTWIGHIEDDVNASGGTMLPSPFTYEIVAPDGTVIDSGSGTSFGSKLPPPQGPQKSLASSDEMHRGRKMK